jgi:hypothetical protein
MYFSVLTKLNLHGNITANRSGILGVPQAIKGSDI